MAGKRVRQLSAEERFLFFDTPIVILSGFVVLELVRPGTSASVAGWPFILSLCFVGMPHGAVDFVLSRKLAGSDRAFHVRHFVPYTLVLVASLLFFVAAPIAAVILFATVTVVHFGAADARDLQRRFGDYGSSTLTAISALTRGGLILALPFWFAPEAASQVFESVVAVVRPLPGAADTQWVKAAAGGLAAVACLGQLVTLAVRCLHRQYRAAGVELFESACIVVTFATLHPLFAMGLYVLCWHSWRHLATVGRCLEGTPQRRSVGQHLRTIARTHVQSLPLLIPTVVAFGCLAWWRLDTWTDETLAALIIAVFVVVTLPHHLLVERMVARMRRTELATIVDRGPARAALVEV
jgi:Brp/Blh family beta-carotene 15,15'-monooxygenase